MLLARTSKYFLFGRSANIYCAVPLLKCINIKTVKHFFSVFRNMVLNYWSSSSNVNNSNNAWKLNFKNGNNNNNNKNNNNYVRCVRSGE